jgi:hypothetical protein
MNFLNFNHCEGDDDEGYGSMILVGSDDPEVEGMTCIGEMEDGSCRWFDVSDPETLLVHFGDSEDDNWEDVNMYGICKRAHPHGGWCYSGRSTVYVRASPSSSKTEMKKLSDVKVGDQILKLGSKPRSPHFAKVVALPHSRATQAMYDIKMASQHVRLRHKEEPHLVEATSDHTFIRCKARDGDSEEALVKAKDLKVGDCLHTLHGDKLVKAVQKVPEKEAAKSETYTVVTEGGAKDLISVGGLVAHATDAAKVGLAM